MTDCTCRIARKFPLEEKNGRLVNIILQCPLCKAAPALHKALEKLMSNGDLKYDGNDTFVCQWCDVVTNASIIDPPDPDCTNDDCPGYKARAALDSVKE